MIWQILFDSGTSGLINTTCLMQVFLNIGEHFGNYGGPWHYKQRIKRRRPYQTSSLRQVAQPKHAQRFFDGGVCGDCFPVERLSLSCTQLLLLLLLWFNAMNIITVVRIIVITQTMGFDESALYASACQQLHPISLLRLSLLTLLDLNLPGKSLWAWEFHPLNIFRLCLSQTLWNP